MSHAAMPPAERLARGISDGLIRFSAGLEAAEDLTADFSAAFEQMTDLRV
jgi:cystathionine beta-lyase